MDSQSFKEYAGEKASSEFIKLLIDFCGWEDMDKMLRKREDFLHANFPDQVKIKQNIAELDCYMSVIDMFIGLVRNNDFLCSVVEKRRCLACSNHERITKTSLPVTCQDLDIRYINRSLRFKKSEIVCQKCDGVMKMEFVRWVNPVVIIDLDGMQSPGWNINAIQKTLRIEGNKYNLCGFIENRGFHFTAHALRGDGKWYEYDDLHPRSIKVTKDSYKPYPVLLMYGE